MNNRESIFVETLAALIVIGILLALLGMAGIHLSDLVSGLLAFLQ